MELKKFEDKALNISQQKKVKGGSTTDPIKKPLGPITGGTASGNGDG
ncbi:hypothetical protein [Flavobacterium amnicola]|nr:hypothetical protein [Flavobacterium amnicola]